MAINNIADMERVIRELDAERDAKNAAPTKSCFVISPIGEDGTETRKRADQILKFLIQPAVSEFGYAAIRADAIAEPGLITSQVIDRIINDDLVIADLTGHNPNVYYELAIRHAVRKPFVQIAQTGEVLPFDIVGMRTIPVDHHDLDSVARALDELRSQVAAIERNPAAIQTPISVTLDVTAMRKSERPEDRLLADMMRVLGEINSRVLELQTGQRPRAGRKIETARLSLQDDGPFGLIDIAGEEGNRRDALLTCGYCGEGPIPIHFYEGEGIPKLLDVLGLFHYWKCKGIADRPAVLIMVARPNRELEQLIWHKPPRNADEKTFAENTDA
jgi:hypothetical protein